MMAYKQPLPPISPSARKPDNQQPAAEAAAAPAVTATENENPKNVNEQYSEAYMDADMRVIRADALRSLRSYEMLMALKLPPSELRARLGAEYNSSGVVCALLAGLGMNLLLAPPDKLMADEKKAAAFCFVTTASILCNLACVALSTWMATEVNLLTDAITPWFVRKFVSVTTVINAELVNLGFGTLLVSVLMYVLSRYPESAAYVCVAFCIVLTLVICVVYNIATWARFSHLRNYFRDVMELEDQDAEKVVGGAADIRVKAAMRASRTAPAAGVEARTPAGSPAGFLGRGRKPRVGPSLEP